MGIKELLDLLREYPEVTSINYQGIELFISRQPQAQIQPMTAGAVQALARDNDMPPDDVMMFASTPTFDEMVQAAKVKE